jgi:hypothetical protein
MVHASSSSPASARAPRPLPRHGPRSRLSPGAAPLLPSALLLPALLLPALLLAGPPASRAGTLELQVAPLPSRTPTGPCPQTLTVVETPQPYREGSYAVDGRAALEAIATGWRLAGRDGFSATWTARLRPAWQRCLASAGAVRFDGEPFREHSHVRLRFSGGQVQLILDMSGRRDPNGYTPLILRAAVSQGQPVWSWAGTD